MELTIASIVGKPSFAGYPFFSFVLDNRAFVFSFGLYYKPKTTFSLPITGEKTSIFLPT